MIKVFSLSLSSDRPPQHAASILNMDDCSALLSYSVLYLPTMVMSKSVKTPAGRGRRRIVPQPQQHKSKTEKQGAHTLMLLPPSCSLCQAVTPPWKSQSQAAGRPWNRGAMEGGAGFLIMQGQEVMQLEGSSFLPGQSAPNTKRCLRNPAVPLLLFFCKASDGWRSQLSYGGHLSFS